MPKQSNTSCQLSQHEINCLNHISSYTGSLSQRELSRKMGLSLGFINTLLKRLMNTGYIKITQLNKKRLDYILTPKGLSEVAFKSYQYITKTINNYNQIQCKMRETLQEVLNRGYSDLFYYGDGDLFNLLSNTIRKDFHDIIHLKQFTKENDIDTDNKSLQPIVINLTSQPLIDVNFQVINLHQEIKLL